MADSVGTLSLNKGLDLVTPPVNIEPGSLIDCLNYELTDIAGYRRIDGYERYDGFPNGAIYEYFNVKITAVPIGGQALIQPGDLILRTGVTVPEVEIGTIVGVTGGNFYDIVPNGNIDQFTLVEEFLTLSDNESFLKLSDTGLLKLSDTSTLGDTFVVRTSVGADVEVTIDSTPIAGRTTATPLEYIANLRTYSALLRSLVQDAPTPIAGLYWFEDRLLAAVNTTEMTVSVLAANPQPLAGARVRWNGVIYRMVNVDPVILDTTNQYRVSLLPIGESLTVDDALVEVNTDGTAGTTWIADVSATANTDSDNSMYAALGHYHNPQIDPVRGFDFMEPATTFGYDAGNYTSFIVPPLTLDAVAKPESTYFVVGDAGATVLEVALTQVTEIDGDFSVGTATGLAQVTIINQIAGTRDYLKDNDEIHSVYPTTGSSRVLTVNGTPTLAALAGTGALDAAGTRYVWGTFNFFGQSSTLSAFGANGAGRAFWADKESYGMIRVMDDADLDKPKYLSFHASKLALGFAHGSVMFSVVGEYYNWLGTQGALEIATGDDITGLLELPGDTLAVFGRRTVRKIRGQTDADMVLETVSGTSGCFDYTAVLIGQDAIYATHNGITTLQQSSAYGDFVGKRISDPISTWLRPKLVKNRPGFEIGGTVCAYPVRAKSQYRLVLATGDVVIATFTDDGPKIMFMNHGLTGTLRVPYAISSEISDTGLERIHARWTELGLEKRAIELDTGWGFDGRSFRHFFDTAHQWNKDATAHLGIEKVRMYGQGYGLATLDIKSSGIEDDFFQEYHETVQDISMPVNPDVLYDRLRPVTSVIDQANWGLGIKLRIQGSIAENSTETEPPHICQVLVLHVRTEGAKD